MTQLHRLWGSVAIVSLVVAAFMVFYTQGIIDYSVTDYNSSQLQTLREQGDQISDVANDTKTSIMNIVQPNNAFDVIGGFFSSGYNVLRSALVGFDSVFTITQTGVESLEGVGGGFTDVLMITLVTLLVLAVFIGIGLAIIMKSDKL